MAPARKTWKQLRKNTGSGSGSGSTGSLVGGAVGSVVGSTGSLVGGAVGSVVGSTGSLVGGAVGSVVGSTGSLVGGAVGSVVGGAVGSVSLPSSSARLEHALISATRASSSSAISSPTRSELGSSACASWMASSTSCLLA